MSANQLRIESPQGLPLAEYRIRQAHIEVRVPRESREAEFSAAGSWRRLSAREFSAHLAQNPALAQWLRARAQRPGSAEAEDEPFAA